MASEFRTLSLNPEGDTAWEAKIPELDQMGSHVVVTKTKLAYFVGTNREGSLLIRAFGRNTGQQAWQKDELLAKEVHSSAGNGSPDLAALVNDKESLCVGWGRTVANEHQPMLAKLSAEGEVLWVRQLAKRTVPVWWGMKESLILDAKGDAIFVAERAEPGSIEKKSGIWTVSKFSGSDGKPLWQHARHSKIHDKDMSAESGAVGGGGSAWRVLTDKECNTICIRKIESAGFVAFKLSSDQGRLMWETQIGKP